MAYFNQLLKIKWNKTMQSSILTLHIDLSKCDWNTINVTLGSRGYFFLIDTEAALTQKKAPRRKK